MILLFIGIAIGLCAGILAIHSINQLYPLPPLDTRPVQWPIGHKQ